jgi:hypothetical protein
METGNYYTANKSKLIQGFQRQLGNMYQKLKKLFLKPTISHLRKPNAYKDMYKDYFSTLFNHSRN